MLQVAVEGCCHGDLDKIYGTLQQLERLGGKKIDLLICCGDFQARALLPSATTMSSTSRNCCLILAVASAGGAE